MSPAVHRSAYQSATRCSIRSWKLSLAFSTQGRFEISLLKGHSCFDLVIRKFDFSRSHNELVFGIILSHDNCYNDARESLNWFVDAEHISVNWLSITSQRVGDKTVVDCITEVRVVRMNSILPPVNLDGNRFSKPVSQIGLHDRLCSMKFANNHYSRLAQLSIRDVAMTG